MIYASLVIVLVLCFLAIPFARIKQIIHPYVIAMYVIVIAMTFFVTCFCFFVIPPVVESIKQSRAENAANERTQLTEMFPPPWLYIYDKCVQVPGYRGRAILLSAWIKQIERENSTVPMLSWEAIQDFAAMIGKSRTDGDYARAAEKLTPFLKLKSLKALVIQEEHDG